MTKFAASGRGCSCCRSYLSSETRSSSSYASSRWSSCTGIIISPSWCTHGSLTPNTLHRRAGSWWWIIVFTLWCTLTTLCAPLNSTHRVSFQWWSLPFNSLRWSSDVRSTFGRTGSSNKPVTLPATSHRQTLICLSPCTPVTSFYSPASST